MPDRLTAAEVIAVLRTATTDELMQIRVLLGVEMVTATRPPRSPWKPDED